MDGQALLLLSTSFSYRLWVLKTDIEKQRRERHIWTLALVAIASLIFLNSVILKALSLMHTDYRMSKINDRKNNFRWHFFCLELTQSRVIECTASSI